jgi:hypothetical protein
VEIHFISPDATIAELKQKARECEERAEKSPEPEATALREEAKQYRDLAGSLGSGLWPA